MDREQKGKEMKATKLTLQTIQHARQYLALGEKETAIAMLRNSAQAKLDEADKLLADQYKQLKGSPRVRTLGRLRGIAQSDARHLVATAQQIEKYGKVI
jgi:hypothetical protein